jgi:hypothetical protein
MLGYHFDMPLTSVADSMQFRMEGWYPSSWGLNYPQYSRVGRFKNPRVSVRSMISQEGDTANSYWHMNGPRVREPKDAGLEDAYFAGISPLITQLAASEADKWLDRLPSAFVDMTLTRTGNKIRTTVRVDSIYGHRERLALRIMMFEDTVRLMGGTNRRVHFNVVRRFAQTEQYPLGLPIAADKPSTTSWTFDLDEIQKSVQLGRDTEKAAHFSRDTVTEEIIKGFKEWTDRFPDVRDWSLNPARLHIVAFVQDLETGEILQGAESRIPAAGGRTRVVR